MNDSITLLVLRRKEAVLSGVSPQEQLTPTKNKRLFISNYQNGQDCSQGIETKLFTLWMLGRAIDYKGFAYPSQAWVGQIQESSLQMTDLPTQFVNGAYCGVCSDGDSVHVFNDFMGLFPVYYYVGKDSVHLSSSLKTLKKAVNAGIDEEAVAEYLRVGYNYSFNTVYKGIKVLPPASRLIIDRSGGVKIEHYTSWSDNREERIGFEDLVEKTEDVVKKSFNRIYSDELKYSLSITGGMDSRLIFLNWPDRENLLTETAGDGTSDYIKAREIISRIGNIDLHALEDLKESTFAEGFAKYYDECDNPLLAYDQFSFEHLQWKIARGSDIHLSGVGGELLDGENLYLSRKPSAVIRESISGYNYRSIHMANKADLIAGVLGISLSGAADPYSAAPTSKSTRDYIEDVVATHDKFIGTTKFAECYTERFRTYRLANAGYKLTGLLNLDSYFCVMPYNDTELMHHLVRYHPQTRELRKLALALLKRDTSLSDIPTDTTHLPVSYPYQLQRFMRALRMVANIGFQKKIPLIQKGEAPKFRAFPYFDHQNVALRKHMRETILASQYIDNKRVGGFLDELDKIQKYSFYVKHGGEGTLLKLYRLARALQD